MSVLESLEGMGRQGAMYALGIAIALVIASVACLVAPSVTPVPAFLGFVLRGSSFLLAGAAAVFGMVGVKGLSVPQYGTAEDAFPSLSTEDFTAAVNDAELRPLCVCARCLIHLPAQFSTGSCPRCNSTVEYFEIRDDEDARMVLASIA